ncbi:SDR family NAD(P)-dependent oxidoreductase [Legionella tunisiensis]|uniref:SDR family NAD(P)-dependent oxidoreductase n=1 Tax=Legionella tunisiensis TaxID=1034944 RepID=UPI00030DCABF|nr:SDR family NAD(P)-dependent oxidoreductase [Legionella tunisiensis]
MISIITGATGCLGLNLTKRLIHEGHEVIALGRNEHLGKILSQLGAKFIAIDLAEKEKLKKYRSMRTLFFIVQPAQVFGVATMIFIKPMSLVPKMLLQQHPDMLD